MPLVPSVPTDSQFNTFDETFETTLQSLIFMEYGRDPFFMNTVLDNTSAQQGNLSKEYTIERLFEIGNQGIVEPITATELYGRDVNDFGPTSFLQENLNKAIGPDPRKSPFTRPFLLRFGMGGFRSTLTFTREEKQLAATAGDGFGRVAYADHVTRKMTQYAQTLAQTFTNAFYKTGKFGALAQTSNGRVVDSNGDTTDSGEFYTFQPDNEATQRFNVNDTLDFYYSNADFSGGVGAGASGDDPVLINDGYVGYVVYVDYAANEVTVKFIDVRDGTAAVVEAAAEGVVSASGGSTGNTFDIPNGSTVVQHGSRDPISGSAENTNGVFGYDAWYKSSGTLLGNAALSPGNPDVATHPQLRSYVETGLNQAMSRILLTTRLDAYHRDPTAPRITDIVTTPGSVTQLQTDLTIGMNGGMMPAGVPSGFGTESYDRVPFNYRGQTINIHASHYAPFGEAIGFSFEDGNWSFIVPTAFEGWESGPSGVTPRFPHFFEAPAGGYSSAQVPLHAVQDSLTRFTGNTEMPGIARYQFAPRKPKGFRRAGLKEQRILQ